MRTGILQEGARQAPETQSSSGVLVVVILGVQESQDLRKVRLRPEVANGPQTSFPNSGPGLEAREQTRH